MSNQRKAYPKAQNSLYSTVSYCTKLYVVPVPEPEPQDFYKLVSTKMFDALMADYSEELSLLRTHYGSVNRTVLLGISTKEGYVCISPVSIGSNVSHSMLSYEENIRLSVHHLQ